MAAVNSRMAIFSGKRSIYGRITAKANRKGWLPADFALPGAVGVPGEADGLLLYHSDMKEIGWEAFDEFVRHLKGAMEGNRRKSEADMALFLKAHHVLTIIDRLFNEVFNARSGVDILSLVEVAYGWAAGSDDVNMVKLGISLMGMLNVEDRPECRSAIIALGKHEEFTFYSLFAVSEWKDARRIATEYADNLKGWGKTHAELWLEP